MTTYTAHCKFCEKKYIIKSKWVPGDILELIVLFRHFFHTLRYHRKDCGFKRLIRHFFKIWQTFFKCIGISLLILIKLILYPIYLLLDLLY